MKVPTPKALRSSAIYQIFPRNYTEAGTLQAAAARLDEVAELGFDYVYLTPVHPIGLERRKGSLGSPYAIADYRAVDPLLGGEAGLALLSTRRIASASASSWTSSTTTHPPTPSCRGSIPSGIWKGPDGKPGPRIADWSDVADLDYSQKALWDYQIETLENWARFGADGFRCDVASLVPGRVLGGGPKGSRSGASRSVARPGRARPPALAGGERAQGVRDRVQAARPLRGLRSRAPRRLRPQLRLRRPRGAGGGLEGRALPRLLSQAPRGPGGPLP